MKSICKSVLKDNYSVFIFDLDNTLYCENDYLFAAYHQVAKNIQKNYKIPESIISDFLKQSFLEYGRQNLFKRLLEHFELPDYKLDSFLTELRTVEISPKIKLNKDTLNNLNDLVRKNKKIFVLTNGNLIQQQNKIKNIDWKGLESNIKFYFANLYQPKPSGISLDILISENNFERRNCLMIGDQEIDKQCALNSNVDFLFGKDYFKYVLKDE